MSAGTSVLAGTAAGFCNPHTPPSTYDSGVDGTGSPRHGDVANTPVRTMALPPHDMDCARSECPATWFISPNRLVYDSTPQHIHDNLRPIAGRGPGHERGIRHVPTLRRIHCRPSAPHEYGVATHGQVNWRSQQNRPLCASIARPLGHC